MLNDLNNSTTPKNNMTSQGSREMRYVEMENLGRDINTENKTHQASMGKWVGKKWD